MEQNYMDLAISFLIRELETFSSSLELAMNRKEKLQKSLEDVEVSIKELNTKILDVQESIDVLRGNRSKE